MQALSYYLKKNIYDFGKDFKQPRITQLKLSLSQHITGSRTLLYAGKTNFLRGLVSKQHSKNLEVVSGNRYSCKTALYFQGRHPVSRQQLLYIFLREQYLLKKSNLLLKFKKLLPAFKLMVISQSTGFYQKLNSGQGSSQNLVLYQTLNDYFFSPSFYFNINKGSRWLSMEEIINHFLFYSEGPCLPQGFSQGSVEAPKGHLGVSIISNGSNKPLRARIRSSILVMAGHVNSLVQGVGLGDFVVIVSASNIVVGEIDR